MTSTPPPEPKLWRFTGRPPLMHTYEIDRPYPGNALAPDSGRKIDGVIRYMEIIEHGEDDPDEIEIHVCPTGKIGFPDERSAIMKDGKRLVPESWHVVTFLRADAIEVCMAASGVWIDERQAELEDVETEGDAAGS